MRLLIDTDAFCKLAVADLLPDALGLIGASVSDCGRLPALPYMLRRGTLPRVYGSRTCDRMIPLAESMPAVLGGPSAWLERLRPVTAIDPGEAILFSVAAAEGLPVVSGDLRSLQALKDVLGFPAALAGRVVVLEAILLALYRRLGPEVMMRRVESLRPFDTVVGVCFAPDERDPEGGLASYYRGRVTELAPLILWAPPLQGDEA